MNYSDRFKVDGMHIKDLKPGIYNTFYYERDGKKKIIEEINKIEVLKSGFYNSFYYERDGEKKIIEQINKIEVLKINESIVIKCGKIIQYYFNDGRLFKKIIGNYPEMKYLDKNGELYKIENHYNKRYSIIQDENDGIIIYLCSRFSNESKIMVNTYHFNNMKINVLQLGNTRIEEVHEEKFGIIWNPKDLDLYIPRIIIKEFLHIYFLMKNILGNKLNNKDLRQYIFRFLFDL
jgi:hypothetical protein